MATSSPTKNCNNPSSSNKRKDRDYPEYWQVQKQNRIKHWGPFTKEKAREAIQDISYDLELMKPRLVRSTTIWNKDREVQEEIRHALADTNHKVDKLCEALDEVRDLLSLDRISYSPETPAALKPKINQTNKNHSGA